MAEHQENRQNVHTNIMSDGNPAFSSTISRSPRNDMFSSNFRSGAISGDPVCSASPRHPADLHSAPVADRSAPFSSLHGIGFPIFMAGPSNYGLLRTLHVFRPTAMIDQARNQPKTGHADIETSREDTTLSPSRDPDPDAALVGDLPETRAKNKTPCPERLSRKRKRRSGKVKSIKGAVTAAAQCAEMPRPPLSTATYPGSSEPWTTVLNQPVDNAIFLRTDKAMAMETQVRERLNRKIFRLINWERVKAGIPPMQWNDELFELGDRNSFRQACDTKKFGKDPDKPAAFPKNPSFPTAPSGDLEEFAFIVKLKKFVSVNAVAEHMVSDGFGRYARGSNFLQGNATSLVGVACRGSPLRFVVTIISL